MGAVKGSSTSVQLHNIGHGHGCYRYAACYEETSFVPRSVSSTIHALGRYLDTYDPLQHLPAQFRSLLTLPLTLEIETKARLNLCCTQASSRLEVFLEYVLGT